MEANFEGGREERGGKGVKGSKRGEERGEGVVE